MKIVILAFAPMLIAIAAWIQWKDCVRDYGNTMGVYGLINSIWIVAALCIGIGISRFVSWPWAVGMGVATVVLYYPTSALIERVGIKHGPRRKSKNAQQDGGGQPATRSESK
jgi:hypothetical protein